MGFNVSKDLVKPTMNKVKAIRKIPASQNVCEIREFIGT